MLNIIRIKKASFYGYHGVFQQEQNIGGKFEADVDLYTNFTQAATTDKLQKTINYEQVYKLMSDLALKKKFYLIETLSNAMVDELFQTFPLVYKIALRVRKNNPPIGGVVDCVEVEVVKTRDEWNVIIEKL
ncbi:MAG: dihydroneopterin aldolase [Ignavibacteria bacterium CG_4_8_14_3_um_filter_37_9]|nr:dihydroneopterin aldolase [Ignavibacteria bacterium]OIO23855.1 MAG: dihydroneopterin aldolase [Ignavibacteria bacterium CG1_02_37_35]PIP78643.1 MAG: dihydroneopterin aldolase [Ignavibacteria bacterium CG22_combo_CG10-13_8_21_14_all_37_15]PIS45622.1 MAG: dihydroneopterin aldolase [Ignavibacteria bacterium CG08_land_8_20_14_0_20_37_9]PIW99917.1 MAG: dihydroneopterin aldolase [Ignavibacteria bacterium CG_4_8_14_3_um_filter_37_9]PIX93510.1 MAG: dihydroneopterin aldolase [Ignavibacteria bacteriu